MVCAPPVDRPRALTGAIVSRGGASGAGSRTCNNLLSLNPCYIYSMTNVTCRRPFGELGDQQLLDQAKRLAANQRSLEVHILDHLDEIDRRGLALRRGFSSLFDYAVRELGYTDAAAQRRILPAPSARAGWGARTAARVAATNQNRMTIPVAVASGFGGLGGRHCRAKRVGGRRAGGLWASSRGMPVAWRPESEWRVPWQQPHPGRAERSPSASRSHSVAARHQRACSRRAGWTCEPPPAELRPNRCRGVHRGPSSAPVMRRR